MYECMRRAEVAEGTGLTFLTKNELAEVSADKSGQAEKEEEQGASAH
jgi:hypothetical protein